MSLLLEKHARPAFMSGFAFQMLRKASGETWFDMSMEVMAQYYYQPTYAYAYAQYLMSTYPLPPQPDQQHYNALYPATTGAQEQFAPQERLQYSALSQPAYSKVETVSSEQQSSNHQMHNLTQELQHHAGMGEQPQQHMQQTNHAQPGNSANPSTQPSTPDQGQKINRLRKACDSCSARKVKVLPVRQPPNGQL